MGSMVYVSTPASALRVSELQCELSGLLPLLRRVSVPLRPAWV